MNRVGQFNGWTIENRNRRVDNFVAVVTNHLTLAIRVITPLKAYNAVFRGRVAKGMDDPYWLTFYTIMMEMVRYELRMGIKEKVDFIFDEQKGKSKLVQKFWDSYVEAAPPEAKPLLGGRPIHRSDLEFLPLQAADLIAWHIRRNEHEMRLHGHPYKSSVWDRLSTINLVGWEWTKPTLRELFSRVRRKYRFPYDVDRRGLGPR
jgi:hypothetical protein